MLFSHTLFSIPRKGSAVSPGRAFSLLTKNSTPKPNGVLFFLVLWLSVPLVAQGVDLVGELGKILVGPALVVLDDAEQPLAGADQPLEHCCGAGRALTGLVLQVHGRFRFVNIVGVVLVELRGLVGELTVLAAPFAICLLYTSDAADE